MPARLANHPYALPDRLPPRLARVLAYWEGLLRGAAKIPFADDLRPSVLPDLADQLLLIDVFERPIRFRLQSVGKGLGAEDLTGQFVDEVRPRVPLDYLASQCNATVEAGAPSFFRSSAGLPHARLLAPLWGEGRINLLLGIVENE